MIFGYNQTAEARRVSQVRAAVLVWLTLLASERLSTKHQERERERQLFFSFPGEGQVCRVHSVE